MDKEQVLKKCIIEGNVVKLPDIQLERKLYMEVAKALQEIGGKWNRKSQGFVFNSDPSILLGRVNEGEKINLKKQYQLFETPKGLCDKLVELAEIEFADNILEPSAGQGAIINAIYRKYPNKSNISYCELMPSNESILRKDKDIQFLANNFLKLELFDNYFYRIIANPPFTKNQDIDHVRKMFECLQSGGRIVSIMSKHWQLSTNKKETAFREWLDSIDSNVIEIEAGEFSESGTKIATCIVIINK